MEIVSVVGARPQFIKAAMVSRALRRKQGVEEILIHTGQHYDENMSRVFFEDLDIPKPDYDLGIGSGTHGSQTGRMLEALEGILIREKPSLVLVYGDTNTTLAGSLAAAKLHIPVAHVEAGLRSYNHYMPEEINRLLTDHVSDLLFAPTETAVNNLLKEGISPEKIHLVGDVMYDASLYFADLAENRSNIIEELGLDAKGYILATIHRAENTDQADRLINIFNGLSRIAKEVPVVLPLHPRTRSALMNLELYKEVTLNIRIIDPVGYLDMILLEKNAAIIATDSGGIQKESFFYKVPCIVFRDESEWVELVELGWINLISPSDEEAIVNGFRSLIHSPFITNSSDKLFGNGMAGSLIAEIIIESKGNN